MQTVKIVLTFVFIILAFIVKYKCAARFDKENPNISASSALYVGGIAICSLIIGLLLGALTILL